MIIGAYLVIHFVDLIAYSHETFWVNGKPGGESLKPIYGVFPNVLNLLGQNSGPQVFLIVLAILSLLLTIGLKRNWAAIFIWYGWVCLFDRNSATANSGWLIIGWLLLVLSIIPAGEPLSVSSKKEGWAIPKWLYIGTWVLMAISYSINGWDKLQTPNWRDGSALIHVLDSPLARDHACNRYLLSLPEIFFSVKAFVFIALELIFAPLCIWNVTRKWMWFSMVFIHLGILSILNVTNFSIGMLMIHIFTFDPRWIKPKLKGNRILFFDGFCGLCNSSVDFFIKQDIDQALKFSPLQGEEAQKRIPEFKNLPVDTLVLWENGKRYTRSTAVIKSCMAVGGVLGLARALLIVPAPLRNTFYNYVASNRHKWFGKKEVCRIPTPEEQGRILT